MDRLVVSTDVYADPETVYEFLLEFPRYERYSEYLDSVERTGGDGGAGSRYAMRFSWWKLTYTAHSEVTDVDPPYRIDWRVVKDIDAHGAWQIDPLDSLPADAPADAESGCEVRFEVQFDAESADASAVSLPAMVSFGWVLDKVTPLVREEAERVVKRAVRDLEGRDRPVRLDVDTNSAEL
ncbi:SRPBCC family protein [Candidatus Halobonum tyrrellensis]|uniref:Polyketide cyclase/dehydrase n=1 Tax=Candidatus Halobonum tyrrellensis G22 TaxID=1324957 RepID=V4HNC7_9EURY|nr:SRPBCC family protein [Candidatus Halobonum tyrrellensis]ESP89419.1 polyketide cyclase/dehydrase [Candidatus Halobonum tyrrellensis G22]